ncbi:MULTISPECIES: hypothetical protein [Streptomyces]|uniref:hypothetical protein n=1 Tax=Streptomyces TaxID=1883 RepID=UPI0013F417BE|nr:MULTISPECIES: hypothetical protein [Streptomyces]MBT3077680.1 hypothetical protein [Streptomyces sp. COG21]MBT3084525.1 hypothetical protein [Streptomyces sp. COG20]MBT3085431.1 hypothetical protein [Streptomyces sp. CYG21]MBT3099025.1 hypothetical protein [Streptomyces sp. CBG30]MBT3103526.1 hypothetical protein [Streptomyces sp. COG19]
MPTSPSSPRAARSLSVVNEEIRALLTSGGLVSVEGRRRYEELLVEWAAAVRGDVAEAA